MKTSRIYPPWWDTTLTIYNKYEDKQTNVITWYRNVVHKSFWKYIGNKVMVGETVLETNSTICRIPYSEKFLEKFQWEQLPNDQMSEFFTLAQGDIIIKGEVDDILDEYTKGHRSNDLLNKYKGLQGCIVIDHYAINTGVARCSEHYMVTGI